MLPDVKAGHAHYFVKQSPYTGVFRPRIRDSLGDRLPGARRVSRAISRAAFPIGNNNGQHESAIYSLNLMLIGEFLTHDVVHTAAQNGSSSLCLLLILPVCDVL